MNYEKTKGILKTMEKKLTWKNTSSPQRKLCTMSTKEICGGANSVDLKSSDSKGGDSPLIEQHLSSYYEQYQSIPYMLLLWDQMPHPLLTGGNALSKSDMEQHQGCSAHVFGLENAILWAKNWDLTERKM